MSDSCPKTSTASSPFHGADGSDVILHTSDNVDFHVHKIILALASPVFKTIFTLPQPSSETPTSNPTIDVEEPSKTIDILFRMCYPAVPVTMTDGAEILDVFFAASKYEMEHALVAARAAFRELTQSMANPLHAWALACAHGETLEGEAQFATQVWKAKGYTPSPSDVPEIGTLSALVYRRLILFQRGLPIASFCGPPTDGTAPPAPTIISSPSPFHFDDADIVLRAGDGVKFNVHSQILSLTSEPLADMVTKAKQSEVSEGGLPVIDLTEDSHTLRDLLFLCYPGTNGSPVITDFHAAHRLLISGERYAVRRVGEFVKRNLTKYSKSRPLSVYALASARGWNALARLSAFTWLQQQGGRIITPSVWHKGLVVEARELSDWELHDISAIHFRRLCELFTESSRRTYHYYEAFNERDARSLFRQQLLVPRIVQETADEMEFCVGE